MESVFKDFRIFLGAYGAFCISAIAKASFFSQDAVRRVFKSAFNLSVSQSSMPSKATCFPEISDLKGF